MGRDFEEFMEELREEARRTGTEDELAALHEHFRLARQIAERRLALGLSQKALAKRTGIAQSELSRLERGDGNPTIKTLSIVASALKGHVGLVFPAQKRVARRKTRRQRGR